MHKTVSEAAAFENNSLSDSTSNSSGVENCMYLKVGRGRMRII